MLLMQLNRARRRSGDEDGAVLVTVIVVLFVGFLVASMIAASVMFTLRANSSNKGSTQAFVAAESGRDVVISQIANGCAVTSALHAQGTTPIFTADAKVTASAVKPTSFTDAGLTSTCPTGGTQFVVIRSAGTGPDGSATTIDSVYKWVSQYSNVPGGVVTYFSGSVTQGVAHYTGDLVLRDGDWSCNINGILDGDLYVLTGTVSLANGCVINGDIYSNGKVTSNSQSWHINPRPSSQSTGSVTTNGLVNLDSTGGTSIAGSINAKGDVTLGGNGTGTVGGTVTSTNALPNVNSSWVTGAQSKSLTDPVFTPTLAWLLAATQWIDLDASASWGSRYPTTCSMDSAELIAQISTAGPPLVVDFTPCPNNAPLFNGQNLGITIPNITVARDVVILSPAGKKFSVSLNGTLLDDGNKRQLYFVHVDTNANHLPTCGNGNTQDQFDVAGSVDANLRVMVYAPCGLGGTVNASFSGQLYADDTTHFISNSIYTCKPMTWPVVLPQLGCTIKGQGGVLENSTLTQSIGDRVYQSEK